MILNCVASLTRRRTPCIYCFRANHFQRNPVPDSGTKIPPTKRDAISRLLRFWDRHKMPTTMQFLRKDNLNPGQHLIVYRYDLNRVTLTSALCIAFFCCAMAGISEIKSLYRRLKGIPQPEPEDPYDELSSPAVGYFILANLIIITASFAFITRRTIMRMYYNQRKQHYVLITMNPFNLLKHKQTICKPGSAHLAPISEYLDWFNGNVKIDGRRFIVHDDYFKLPIYCNVLFGVTKPEVLKGLDNTNVDADTVFADKLRGFKMNGKHPKRNI
ncbi:hypothetical protein HDE_04665 [Halotydeus destructor]|nr:hypothetical protein HDE_04665 [Halotydeus destructor]